MGVINIVYVRRKKNVFEILVHVFLRLMNI